MKVTSFVRVDHKLVAAEIEVSLVPGLPQFHFIGLPDLAVRESGLRVRAAIREQGFELPQAHQILVHIKPTYVRKTSRGIDLAVAAALLYEMNQLDRPVVAPTLYGELSLKGEVVQPEDASDAEPTGAVITGPSSTPLPFPSRQIKHLRDLLGSEVVIPPATEFNICRPPLKISTMSRSAALLARVVAAGEHSLLLAGPAGSGKSTLAEAIASFIEEPTLEQIKEVRPYWSARNERLAWRPVLRPHHSITPLAMIGGGASLWPGEITRAHNGVLIMDELLEFHSEIQESLREPVENGVISIVRAANSRTFPARVLLIGTTNLCKCGNFVPRRTSTACRCAKVVRQRIFTRLTGPFVDRFAVVALSDDWDQEKVSVKDIARDVSDAIDFRRERGQTVPNSRLMPEVIEESLPAFERKHLLKTAARSRRRKSALLQVARTLADLRRSERVEARDLEGARELSVQTHQILEQYTD
jgi:magnesium chelatase family protein